MLLNKERCAKCHSERSVRKCPRHRDKLIGWKCCNSLRIDLKCPSSCPYAAQQGSEQGSPFPAFRADSNTEFTQAVTRYLDLWCFQPNAELEGLSPSELAGRDPERILAWLEKFQYPANFPVALLLDKLQLKHEPLEEIVTPETVAYAYLDAVIALEWGSLRPLTVNDLPDADLAARYAKIMSAIPELNKARNYEILHAGAADDGVSAIVAVELNRKKIWTLQLSAASGAWKVKQNFNGTPQLYYAQNALFRKLAEALGNGNEQESWTLLQQNLPLYPDCADLYYYRGLYWQIAKQPEKAKDDLRNALALDNHFFEAGFTLATLYLNERGLEPAREILTQLHQDRPDDLNVTNNLAATEAGLGNTDLAVKLWSEILAAAPAYEPAQKNLERYGR